MSSNAVKLIDLEEIIRSKNPRLLKILPKPLLRYIKKTIHQDEINDFLLKHGDAIGLDFCERILEYFRIGTHVNDLKKIPLKGGYIFASNHPLGGLDAIALMKAIGEIRTDMKFLVNDILMNLENLKPLFIPVNKHGKNAATTLKLIDEAYASDQAVLVFPAGLVSRKQRKHIRDLEWKKSFITKARRYHKDVIPVHVKGANSKFFYNLANLRKRLGVKANLEMFYLVDEMFLQQNNTIEITFGDPIPYTTFDRSQSDIFWAQKVKEQIYAMADKRNLPLATTYLK